MTLKSNAAAQSPNSETDPVEAPEERRRAQRMANDAILEFDGRFGRPTGTGQMVNMSILGACFSSRLQFWPGHRVQARLHTSHGPLKIYGRIVWLTQRETDNLYGIEFKRIHLL